jgi:hypothetical protein
MNRGATQVTGILPRGYLAHRGVFGRHISSSPAPDKSGSFLHRLADGRSILVINSMGFESLQSSARQRRTANDYKGEHPLHTASSHCPATAHSTDRKWSNVSSGAFRGQKIHGHLHERLNQLCVLAGQARPSMALLRASSSPCLDKLALTAGQSARTGSAAPPTISMTQPRSLYRACEHFCGLTVTLRSCTASFECLAAPSSESSMSRSNYCIHITTNTTR